MKKNKNSGFMLIETLLVSTFVLGAMTYIIIQFSALKRSYNNSFNYNTVLGLYGIQNIHEYATKYSMYDTLKTNTSSNVGGYTTGICSTTTNTNCSKLLTNLNINKILFVKDSTFKTNVKADYSLFANDYDLYQFVKKINWDDTAYHWIVKYNDNTYATIKLTNI